MAISSKPFRILTLDGGGTFALIQARALADLYPGQSGHEVLSHFDLLVGCSGGSVVAALLIENRSPQDIFDLFDNIDNRKRLFGALPWQEAWLSRLTGSFFGNPVGPRFSTSGKMDFLKSVLPQTGMLPLHTLPSHLGPELRRIRQLRGDEGKHEFGVMVVTYDFDRDRARMLRSNWRSAAANFPKHLDSSVALAEAVQASSTAPVNWFDQPAHFDHGRYWDGAMTGYNNPVLVAVSEAIAEGIAPHDIGVLSIGTSAISLPPADTLGMDPRMLAPNAKATLLDSLVKVSKTIIADPPDAHTYLAHLMVGGRVPARVEHCPVADTPIVRMNPLVQPVPRPDLGETYAPPLGWSVDEFERLSKLEIAAIDNSDVELIKRMCDGWMRNEWHNQPVRHGGQYPPKPGYRLEHCWEIGHLHYSEAKRAWLGH